jgi:hypothetical protein
MRGDPRAAPASRDGYDARDRGAARYEPRSGWIGPAPGSRSARDDRADAPLEPERSLEVDARPRAGAWTPSRTEARSTGPREDPGPRYRAVESRAGYAEPGVPAPSEPRYFAPAPRERYAAPSLGGSNREVQRLSGAGNMGSAPPPRYEAAAPRYESPPPRSEAPSHSTAPARESDDSTRREGSRERDR